MTNAIYQKRPLGDISLTVLANPNSEQRISEMRDSPKPALDTVLLKSGERDLSFDYIQRNPGESPVDYITRVRQIFVKYTPNADITPETLR